ncbi:hypothetical protein B566_EDAN018094 [Ephemera danica]|nr:hypothetical protein B566_EDAN018094 [Ephemera danica]
MHRCDVCEQEFSGKSVLDTHLAGAKHAKKLKSLEILQQLAATGQNFSQGGPSGNLRCEACGVDANSSQQLQTHLAGNKHKQRMMKLGGKMPPPPTPPTSLSSLMPPPPAPPPLKKAGTQLEQQSSANPPPPGTSAELPQRFYCEHVESRKHQDKECGKSQHSNKHHPYRRVPQARFQQSSKKKKKKQPIAFLTPLSSSFVPGSML